MRFLSTITIFSALLYLLFMLKKRIMLPVRFHGRPSGLAGRLRKTTFRAFLFFLPDIFVKSSNSARGLLPLNCTLAVSGFTRHGSTAVSWEPAMNLPLPFRNTKRPCISIVLRLPNYCLRPQCHFCQSWQRPLCRTPYRQANLVLRPSLSDMPAGIDVCRWKQGTCLQRYIMETLHRRPHMCQQRV